MARACPNSPGLAGLRRFARNDAPAALRRVGLHLAQMLVDGRAPHAQHLGHVIRRTLALERALGMQRLDQFAPMLARERVERHLTLAQPAVQEGVDALLPVVLEQLLGLRDHARAAQEQIERRLHVLERRDVEVDAHDARRAAVVVEQRGAHAAHAPAVPVHFLVRSEQLVARGFLDVLERGIVADLALREIVRQIRHGLVREVVDHDFGERKEQRRDAVRDVRVALEQTRARVRKAGRGGFRGCFFRHRSGPVGDVWVARCGAIAEDVDDTAYRAARRCA
ncbi:hypothetical protein PT2222_30064 [Paraburkholderia tropica]